MKIQSVVIILLGVGGGLRSKNNFQNLMDCFLYRPRHFQKISLKSVHNFLSNPANRQTKKRTNDIKNATSLSEVKWKMENF